MGWVLKRHTSQPTLKSASTQSRPHRSGALALLVQFWALYVPGTRIQTGLPLDKVGALRLFALVTWFRRAAGVQPKWVISLMVVQAAT